MHIGVFKVVTGIRHYDVRGSNYIGSPLKRYFEDVGFRTLGSASAKLRRATSWRA